MNVFPSRFGASRLIVVVGSVVTLVIASLAVAAYSEHEYRVQSTQAAQVQARVLADTVTAALSFGDRAGLQEYVNAQGADANIEAVGVFDEAGRRVASYGRGALPERLSALGVPTLGHLAVVEPVVERQSRLGAVYLRYRPEPFLRRLSRYVGPGLLLLMASMMFFIMALDSRALIRTNRALVTQMAEREKAEAALRQSQKMEAIGRLTGGVAHDFNNMLAIVLGSLDLLLNRYPDAEPRLLRLAGNAMEGAKRASGLTQRLLAFSRLQPLQPSVVDIAGSMNETAELLRRTLGEDIAVEVVSAGGLWRAHIDLPQLESAIVNLAINARDAMPGGGKLTIESANTFLDRAYTDTEEDIRPGQYVQVAITDTGAGIPAEIMAQVFEPFFTTKPQGSGTGLGLSQVHGFIKQSGGHIRLYSEVGIGTTVKLYLPRSMAEAERPEKPASASRPAGPRGVTVLVVEDESGVREFAVEALTELGFDVISADGATSALAQIGAHPEISILLSDVVMPGVNGRQLANEALRLKPSLRVVFMTGYTQNAIVHNGVLDPGTRLLSKPFTVSELEAEMNDLLSASDG